MSLKCLRRLSSHALFGFFILRINRWFVFLQRHCSLLRKSPPQWSGIPCYSPPCSLENDKTIRPEILVANGKSLSELHDLLLSDKLPLLDYACSLFCGRTVVNVRIESGGFVWVFEFASGPSILIEACITNHGCMGLMADGADGSLFPNAKV